MERKLWVWNQVLVPSQGASQPREKHSKFNQEREAFQPLPAVLFFLPVCLLHHLESTSASQTMKGWRIPVWWNLPVTWHNNLINQSTWAFPWSLGTIIPHTLGWFVTNMLMGWALNTRMGGMMNGAQGRALTQGLVTWDSSGLSQFLLPT